MTSDTTGKQFDLSPQQMVDLAQYALNDLERDNTPVEPDKPDTTEMTDTDRIASLEKQLTDMTEATKQQTNINKIRTNLSAARQSHDLTKNNAKLGEKIDLLTAAIHSQNPNSDIFAIYNQQVEDFKGLQAASDKIAQDAAVANSKIAHNLVGIKRGEGGVPVIDTSREYRAEDITSGASRRALAEMLKQYED